ncbi:hypothetical protein M0R45_027578 [Rubus argutus]|uniref:Uncharacterized protein n=1 Tax=Rubus argutus TaxID=59490 RepID=A0AAW1X497_RUBAR
MKTIFWNIRGLANSSTQRTLRSLVKHHSPDFLCLAEPMTVITKIKQSFWRSIGMNLIGVNERGQLFPNIWLFCSTNVLSPLIISSSSQHIFLQFNVGRVPHGMVFVYAATTVVDRRPLWLSLAQVCSAFSGPLLILGDFNSILGAHEKSGGNLPRCVSCDEFQAMVDTCGLILLDLKGSPFTWTNGRGLSSHIEMLLDRCFCSLPWLDAWPLTSCSTLVRHCSDHNPILVVFEKYTSQGPSPFRFQQLWVQHPQFLSIVSSAWSSVNVYGCPQFILQQKLKFLKPLLKDWNRTVFGNVDLVVDLARISLEKIQLDISEAGFTDDRHNKEIEAHNVLANALLIQDQFWSSKAREKWVRDGDRNTGYYQRIAKIRRAQSFISHLRIGSNLQTDVSLLRQHVVDYFTKAFTNDGCSVDTGLVSKLIPSLVTVAENDCLTATPTPDEIKVVAFSMDPDSAPGPDGFSGHFYRSCWDFIGSDVVNAVCYFFESGFIQPNLNCSFVALLPKVPEADVITQFRPIAMANFIFKIITRILADRLSPIASRIILPNQFAFLKGRQISDCIFLTSECVNLLDAPCIDGNVAIKFDIARAFDTLDWAFLLRVLTAFGFHAIFIDWIRTILASAKLSILFNGSPVGFFSCSRGVRQGDPLSPLLFCLAEEVLSRGIVKLVSSGNKDGLKNLLDFIDEYGFNSGQLVNKTKSQVFLGKFALTRRPLIYKWLGIPIGALPFTYLGVPIFSGRPKRLHFQGLADKVKSRFPQWRGSSLSMAGRVTLVKSVINSMLSHSFFVYAWPQTVLVDLRRWVRNFIWSGNVLTGGFSTVAWANCCTPIDEGGLGLKNFPILNQSFLLKKFWDLLTSTTLAANFFCHRFLNKFGQPCNYYKRSSIWPGLRPLFVDIKNGSQWIVGSGSKIDFWHHNWLGSTITDLLNISPSVAKSLQTKLSSFIINGNWVCPIDLQALCAPIWNDVVRTTLPCKVGLDDRLIWKSAKDGNLTVALAYDLKHTRLPRVPWARFVWHPSFRPRNSIILWKYLHRRLLTNDVLQRRGFQLSSVCSLSHHGVETSHHLFFNCSFAAAIWWNLLNMFQVNSLFTDLYSFFSYPIGHGFCSQLSVIWWGMIGAGFYAIWHARNALRFQNSILSASALLHSIRLQLQEINLLSKGTMKNSVDDLCILRRIGILGRPSKAPKIIEVIWQSPSVFQVKINTDGAARGSPGLAGFGGIFRDHLGRVLGCFAGSLGTAYALEAELHAVVHAIHLASLKGWTSLWIESDSTLVIHFLSSINNKVPWRYSTIWFNCRALLASMSVKISHVYREGNQVADCLANFGVDQVGTLWWDSCPPCALSAYCHDLVGLPNYRFRL